MSLFGKKGADDSEAARQLAIKQSLNRELSTGIKKLQRDHISSDSAIRSGDTANRICNVLEAIFLHELKDSYASKLSSLTSYLAPSGDDQETSIPTVPSASFWAFVSKFTHKDVVAQIKTLSLINSEVGCCRAWIRMGLNDYLMDSYVDAMLSDAKTIKTYYKRSSFLRDTEQPHIMKNYLQGLGNFAFQLSFNSSVLNIWGAAPMIASGSWAPPRDSPVSEPSTPRAVGLAGLVHQYSDPTSTYTAPRTKQVDSPLAEPGPNVAHAIESSFHESEISSNLLHSPSDDDGPLVVPVAMDTETKKQSPLKESRSEKVATTHQQRVVQHQKDQPFQNQARQQYEHAQRLPDCASSESKKKKPNPDDNALDNIESHITSYVDEKDSIEDHLNTKDNSVTTSGNQIPANPFEEEMPPANPFDEAVEGQPSEVQHGDLNPFDEPASATNPFDELPKTSKSERTAPLTISEDGSGEVGASDGGFYGSNFYGSPAKIPEKKASGRQEADNPDMPAFAISKRESSAMPSLVSAVEKSDEEHRRLEDFETHEDSVVDSFQGNSLGARSGWSSSFEHQANTPTTPDALLPGANPTSRSALASYKSLLEDYAAQGTSGPLPATNWEDLIGETPGQEQLSISLPSTPKDKHKPSRLTSIGGLSDTDITLEYEVIPFSSSPTSKYADTRTQGLLNIVTIIGREKGLDSQNYQCKGCSRPVGIIYGKANVCSYDGCYYCYECHTDDEAIIPAKILYSWDFRKHKVSKHTKIFLQQIEEMPLIDIDHCNPSLYKAIPELADIMVLRSQLKYLKAYLFTCQQSVAEELRKKVWPREYMLEHMHLYSTQDFLQIQGGNLTQFLKRVIVFAAKHVQQCTLCSQKGFVCEICNSEKVIYPFDVELTVRCETCTTVFHKTCKTEAIPCPKCERRRIRKGHPQFHGSQEEVDFASPFT